MQTVQKEDWEKSPPVEALCRGKLHLSSSRPARVPFHYVFQRTYRVAQRLVSDGKLRPEPFIELMGNILQPNPGSHPKRASLADVEQKPLPDLDHVEPSRMNS